MRWTVRPPEVDERAKILSVVADAFGGGGDATVIVQRTWDLDVIPPGVELVAAIDDDIIGHVMSAPGSVGDDQVIAIAPLAVAPTWQRQGVGSSLISEALRRIEARGSLVLILGDPAYYSSERLAAAIDEGVPVRLTVRAQIGLLGMLRPGWDRSSYLRLQPT